MGILGPRPYLRWPQWPLSDSASAVQFCPAPSISYSFRVLRAFVALASVPAPARGRGEVERPRRHEVFYSRLFVGRTAARLLACCVLVPPWPHSCLFLLSICTCQHSQARSRPRISLTRGGHLRRRLRLHQADFRSPVDPDSQSVSICVHLWFTFRFRAPPATRPA